MQFSAQRDVSSRNRDVLMKSLNQEYDLGIEVKYLWELVADSLIMPGQEQEETETAAAEE